MTDGYVSGQATSQTAAAPQPWWKKILPSTAKDNHQPGLRPITDDGLAATLDGLGRGDGRAHDIPENFGQKEGTYHTKNSAAQKMTIYEQILSKFPWTKERGARKAAKKSEYKEKNTIKTSAERILEQIEARNAAAEASGTPSEITK